MYVYIFTYKMICMCVYVHTRVNTFAQTSLESRPPGSRKIKGGMEPIELGVDSDSIKDCPPSPPFENSVATLVSLSPSLSLPLSFSLCGTLSLPHSFLSSPPYFSLPRSCALSLSLSLTHTHTPCLSRSLALSPLSDSLFLALPFSFSLPLPLSPSPSPPPPFLTAIRRLENLVGRFVCLCYVF